MATYFISDLHLEKIESSISTIFSEFLERLDEDDQLYILGDLFESWIGDDNVSELSVFVVNQLKLLSKKGIQVSIMHGNRDFLIGNDFCDSASIQLINDPCIIDINDEKAMLTHGDQLCTDDHEYQAFRSVVRNPIWQKDFLNFPISKREKIAGETKNASKDSKVKKTMEIMDVPPEEVTSNQGYSLSQDEVRSLADLVGFEKEINDITRAITNKKICGTLCLILKSLKL